MDLTILQKRLLEFNIIVSDSIDRYQLVDECQDIDDPKVSRHR